MNTQTGTFRVTSWQELTGEEAGGPKLTRVRAGMAYQGVIDGAGVVELLMYSPDGRVTHFVGLEKVVAKIAGRAGSAVLQHSGTFADGVARSKWFVVPGSGMEGLTGLSGEGRYGDEPADAEHGGQAPFTFSFAFGASE